MKNSVLTKVINVQNLLKENDIKTGKIKVNDLLSLIKENDLSVPSVFWKECKSKTRGFFDIDKIFAINDKNYTPSTKTSNSETTMKNVIGTGITKDEDYSLYVPIKDLKFTPHGNNYEILDNIISSNMFFPAYVYGVSGVGKTAAVMHLCSVHKKPFFRAQITRETVDDDLIGSMKLIDGNTVWNDGPVLKAYRSGGLLLLDEIDLNNTLMILQPILENKPFYIKQTGELVHPSEGFTVIATGNTKGDGNSTGDFIGTTVLNEAFRDRFAIVLQQELPDISVEKKIIKKLMKEYNITVDDTIFDSFVEWVDLSRKSFKEGDIDVYVSTRRIGYILKALRITQDPTKALEITLSRFDEETADALLLLWKSIYKETLEKEKKKNEPVSENKWEPVDTSWKTAPF